MSNAVRKITHTESFIYQRLREGVFIFCLGVALFLVVSLLTYQRSDPGWSHFANHPQIHNAGGRAGAWFADSFLNFFGYFAFIFPVLLSNAAWLFMREAYLGSNRAMLGARLVGSVTVLVAGCGLASLLCAAGAQAVVFPGGGFVGDIVSTLLVSNFNPVGSAILLLALLLIGFTLFTGVSWLTVAEKIGYSLIRVVTQLSRLRLRSRVSAYGDTLYSLLTRLRDRCRRSSKTPKPVVRRPQAPVIKPTKKQSPQITPKLTQVNTSTRYEKDRQAPLFDMPGGTLPSLSLLEPAEVSTGLGYSNAKLELMSREVEQRLSDFGIIVQVVAVHPGPVVTRFEMQLSPGMKVSRITALAKDLARSLSVSSVRIVEVISGKSVVGLELPNEHREMVRLSEVLSAQVYEQARSPLTLALGKDISGHPVIVDLAKMPHLLVAGTTGSGKSVGVNAMLLSLLYKSSPRDLRLLLIDPKMLELSIYDGIPHLIAPVVTDMKEAAQSLRWCVAEMERRYRLMSALGVRNLAGFNKKVREAEKNASPILDPLWQEVPGVETPALEPLPFVVIVIDELADMMMVVGKKVEQLIARIAQKARASGIHMILATQRPSVDILTGLIKSNIPTRISFQVSSKIDSRTILDQSGAENLLGHGDMLFLAPGDQLPMRVHGAFVDDHEVKHVAEDWKKRGQPQYIEEVLDEEGSCTAASADAFAFLGDSGQSTEDADPLYDEAVFFVTKTRRASISSVQRKFKIGYNRAARLIEEMEAHGIVSSQESNGLREVLAPPPRED
jgi:DNA segregation ATPase FtsK/SpoIIIE, S-DNA-T family